MPDSASDTADAKRLISAMLAERPRPTQKQIAAATGLTQSYVAKINRCDFVRLNEGIRKVLEYSKMAPAERRAAEAADGEVADRIASSARRLASRDPEIAEALVGFIERLAALPRSR